MHKLYNPSNVNTVGGKVHNFLIIEMDITTAPRWRKYAILSYYFRKIKKMFSRFFASLFDMRLKVGS